MLFYRSLMRRRAARIALSGYAEIYHTNYFLLFPYKKKKYSVK